MKTNEQLFRAYMQQKIMQYEKEIASSTSNYGWIQHCEVLRNEAERTLKMFDHYFPVEVPGEPVTSGR